MLGQVIGASDKSKLYLVEETIEGGNVLLQINHH